jgi:imidazolonepropionase-like amidohydrolase
MRLALAGGTICVDPATEPIRSGVVLIDGDTIAAAGDVAIPPQTETIDCSGLTISAGFRNSHVHFFERKWADAATIPAAELTRQLHDTFTRYGFTTVFDLGSSAANTRIIRDRIESGDVEGPRILTTGPGIVPPGAMPPDLVLSLMGVMKFPFPEVANAEEAAAAVKALLDDGADGIKLFASSPRGSSLSDETIAAAVDEAHRAGKRVFLHPNTSADVALALRNGVDVIAHTTPPSGTWSELDIRPGVALTPTLALRHFFMRHDRQSSQEAMVNASIDQLRTWIDRGGIVLFGTDLGAVDPDPSLEYELMRDAGMDFRQILASLTTAPAEFFGESGRLASGMPADIVVFEDLSNIRCTVRGGNVLRSTSR